MPAKIPGRRPVMMAATGKRGQVAGRAVGVTLRGETVVELSAGEVEPAWGVDVEDGDVDGAAEVGGVAGGARSFWSRSLTQIADLPVPLQEKPKGQHCSMPQDSSLPPRFVVLIVDSGWRVAFWLEVPQTIVLMASQVVPAGQQRRVVFEARVTQFVPVGQQKLEGKPEESQALKLVAHAAEVVVTRRVRMAMNARARPRGLRFCFRIAVVIFCCSNICRFVFQALESNIKGRNLSKFIAALSSEVISP